ncbi:S-DNA-T family DNA segregation ATPase FtsK/SpoIIIE [Clostridium saccharoperbutylacetonicum]|uniref:DNA translocase FtsK n=1 Tax=Clostridium saccharoperbutylacetonicum N1-4(HMT) TaxID=931276 RepID=M1MFH0_9CLOT|nr:DNA translocase FtsK [Clostridium saccharoperbutylacetonicum]AGF55123.1 DNA translocase FtsK [Clostridium saccharoperbutylacetonicum N1-4(HMT)]NRT64168.1 S-DNA-T family DNA segregation ATPase FtsK/SpoIIIE [Clostridium saccharoperbutylacetonicum]NSB27535.1 S-DNA-T family DNA segregation ATPase FtsK/SpoIIIE [Clostridium saccharoperbutylacetonicum]NSB41024.1 S-DNA-T family DNA segregation ATPase FtsK/SpoIIIE [Clostridium saccharoperbutylacetonicum]
MSRTKGKNRTTKNKKEENTVNPEIVGIVYIATGIILGIAIYTSLAGILSILAQRVSYAVIGIGANALPLYLIYFGFQYIKTRGNIEIKKSFWGITILVIVIMLTFGIINIQSIGESSDFFANIKQIISDDNQTMHGGILSYIICYPLNKIIGALGTYVILLTFSIIAIILIFDITLYDLGLKAYNKGEELRNVRSKRIKEKNEYQVADEEFINIVDNNENKDKIADEKETFLSNVDKKIKILDFMKNSQENNELSPELKSEISSDIQVESFVEKSSQNISHKKEKLDNDVKDVVNKEIQEHISEHKEQREYKHPSLELLKLNSNTKLNSSDKKELIENANKLEEILSNFGVDAKVTQVTKGPSVTRFELQPSPGVKVSKIVNLSDDIALGLAASGIRIEAPIPGKAAVGIEVPNGKQTPVFLREVLENDEFINSKKNLAFALGKDISGKCVVGDLCKMPHTLIAGATGSGKSVCINALIISLLYKYNPDEVKLLMVDPKVVELNVYNGIPHLLIPVVTDPKKAAAALNWAVNEMTNRYKLFADSGVRNMESYNELYNKGAIEQKLPYIVIIVDELADLMMVCPNDVEDYIGRLAQMARAAGMHLVIATQRPSVDVITGVIKANIPSRISFAVSSQIDSRTILDGSGAEKLLGKGDMLYYPVGESKPLRVQGCFISEEEVEQVVSFIKSEQGDINYEEDIIDHINNNSDSKTSDPNEKDEEVDELLSEVINVVVEYGQASTSFIQRKFRIGFNRASRIMDQLEERGIISEKDGSRPRQVLVSRQQLMEDGSDDEN